MAGVFRKSWCPASQPGWHCGARLLLAVATSAQVRLQHTLPAHLSGPGTLCLQRLSQLGNATSNRLFHRIYKFTTIYIWTARILYVSKWSVVSDRMLMAARKSLEKTPKAPVGDRIGYARVSTQEQSLNLQTDALLGFGCTNIYEEKRSAGGTHKRPELDLAIKELRPGDTLVVWRLDRLARSMKEFYKRMEQIEAAGANFHSITENFDFTTAMGKFVLGVLALVAELERQLTIQRTKAGLDSVRKRGVKLGAATKLDDTLKRKVQQLARLKGEERLKVQDIADRCGIAMSTIFAAFPGGRAAILAWKPVKRKT